MESNLLDDSLRWIWLPCWNCCI